MESTQILRMHMDIYHLTFSSIDETTSESASETTSTVSPISVMVERLERLCNGSYIPQEYVMDLCQPRIPCTMLFIETFSKRFDRYGVSGQMRYHNFMPLMPKWRKQICVSHPHSVTFCRKLRPRTGQRLTYNVNDN